MCGIFCRLGYRGDVNVAEEQYWCSLHLKNRGPDDQGIDIVKMIDSNSSLTCAVIAHSRLSVMDVSAKGSQPMASESGDWLISFNGCIYNFQELANDYLKGFEPRSSSDTEILVNLLERYGPAILSKLNGMFSFVVVNQRSGEYIVARDRFGVKPMCYYVDNQCLEIASSPRLLAHRFKKNISTSYVRRGLVTGVFDGEAGLTPYEEIFEFPAGHFMVGSITKPVDISSAVPWYKIEDTVDQRISNSTSNTDLHDLFVDAVRLRLVADVPIAVSQSGGIDSSIISGIARKNISNLTAFTFGSGSDSELPNAEIHCKLNDIKLIAVEPASDAQGKFDELLDTFDAQEAPFLGFSIVAQNLIFKRAKEEGIKVLLGGQGADEVFGGYRKYLAPAVFSKPSDLDYKSRILSILTILGEVGLSKRYTLNDMLSRALGTSRHKSVGIFNDTTIQNLKPKDFSFDNHRIFDILTGSLPTLLRYEDRNSMYHSIETRLPFLDWRIVAAGMRMTEKNLFTSGYPKYALRKAFSQYMPDAITWERNKRGFDTSSIYQSKDIALLQLEYILDNRNTLVDLGLWSNHTQGFIEKLRGNTLGVALPIVLSLMWVVYEMEYQKNERF